MYVVLVEFRIQAERIDAFLERVKRQAAESLEREPGCHQFDVCIDSTAEDRVFLYELYSDREAFDEHLDSAHFAGFDTTVVDWVVYKRVRLLNKL